MRYLLILLLFLCNQLRSQPAFYSVIEYGAKTDSSFHSTEAIQAAIEACTNAGGGTVYFPPGQYKSATLIMKPNVNLYLDNGAVLYATTDSSRYRQRYRDFSVTPRNPVLLFAENADNIAVSGMGEINGQAVRELAESRGVDSFIEEETRLAREAGVDMRRYYKVPPIVNLVYFVNCNNVRFQDVRLIESSSWTLHLQWCEEVYINKIYIYSDLESGVNADGLDIDGCKNVVISDCIIETGDDAIVLKTTNFNGKSESCENVTVTNCVLTSTSAALKLGTESFADFRRISFDNCIIKNTNRGLSIIVRDGATVSDINFSNIVMECNRKHYNWWGNGDPIWLVLLRRNEISKLGSIKNVVFENIMATGQGTSKLEGHPERNLENITLRNVKLHLEEEDTPDQRAKEGLLAHHIEQLEFSNVSVSWEKPGLQGKWAEAVKVEDVNALKIDQLAGFPGNLNQNMALLNIQNTRNAVIQNVEAKINIPLLLEISGSDISNIVVDDINQMQLADRSIKLREEVLKNEVKITK